MCPLIYRDFVLGYLAVLMAISLLVYLKVILVVPRGVDYGILVLLATSVLLSRTLILGGSLVDRVLILLGISVVFYLGSKLIYPKQYLLMSVPKDKEILEQLLGPLDEMKEGSDGVVLKLSNPKDNMEKITAYLKKEAPRPIYYLVLAIALGGIFVYFMLR